MKTKRRRTTKADHHAEAVNTFWHALTGRDPDGSEKDRNVYHLIWSAFGLYQAEWSQKDIRDWVWPVNVVAAGERFTGWEAWTVLLREAVRLNTSWVDYYPLHHPIGG